MIFGSRSKPMGQPMQQAPAMQAAPADKKPGVNWLGVLADALAGAAGQPGQYLAGIQEQRKRADELAHDQRRRSLDMSDWRTKQDYTRDNPAPADDALTQMMRGGGIDPASEQGVALYRQRAEALANPMQFNPDGFGGGQYIQRQPSPPQRPVGKITPMGGSGAPPFPRL